MTDRTIADRQRPNVKKQMEQLAYCLRQAYEFSQSSRSSGLSTKALQAYYSITALANAEVLWLGDGRDSIDARPAKYHRHGLSLVQADSLEASAAALDLDNDASLTGLFGLWRGRARHCPHYVNRDLETSGKLGQSRYDISSSVMELSKIEMPQRPISLTECFQHIPGLFNSLHSARIKPKIARGTIRDRLTFDQTGKAVSARSRSTIHPCSDEILQPILKKFVFSSRLFESISIVDVQAGFVFTSDLTPELFDAPSGAPEIIPDTVDNLYFMGDGDFLNEVGYFYVGLYILGMLSRYYPHTWMKEINRSSLLTILCDEFIDLSLVRAPLMTLGVLDSRVFIYE
ncbi:MAG: hypothetical protein E5V63_03735 [Mesorhizobium sp.]|nr:MAG: hypothetical protein E5V63_03735 [Mesorhizobium sp.]